ncbi:hypothetical protein V2J09_002012 [Rumex salicifolius]
MQKFDALYLFLRKGIGVASLTGCLALLFRIFRVSLRFNLREDFIDFVIARKISSSRSASKKLGLGMGVVTASSSVSRISLGLGSRISSSQPKSSKRPFIFAFKTNRKKKTVSVKPQKPVPNSPLETTDEHQIKRLALVAQNSKGIPQAVSANVASPLTCELDFNEAAAKLESIYNLNSASDEQVLKTDVKRVLRGKRSAQDDHKEKGSGNVVRSKIKKAKRLSLDTRIELKKHNEQKKSPLIQKKNAVENENVKIEKLVRDYSVSTDLVSLDWKKMKIPPVLSSSEHTWLFRLMQPMKTLVQVKENLQIELGREPTDNELGEAVSMTTVQVRRHLEVGRAARHKLIKHNLRLVLFVMNKYFQEFASGPKFQDLCQAGVKGLIAAIDRFEPKKKFRLSTYSLFWIRHAITRSMTVSSFTRVSFGLESVRAEIQKAKLKLMFALKRMPTEEEIVKRVGISPERYQEIMRASKSVISLNSRHSVTQEELIKGITDVHNSGGDKRRLLALLRLALDDVLDSLKPKESLVIRQRYGLDGKGDRTLGEIAGNLNISREMVRKYEMKALMKLKHPARVDYLRQYIY